MGNEDVFLSPGTYEYVIRYITENQIGFFEEFDELYWNVIKTTEAKKGIFLLESWLIRNLDSPLPSKKQ